VVVQHAPEVVHDQAVDLEVDPEVARDVADLEAVKRFEEVVYRKIATKNLDRKKR
jgi:hypothetical protein